MVRIAFGALFGAAFSLPSCQTYDAFPETPSSVEVQDTSTQVAGRAPSPNIMFLIDRSGSMVDSASGTIDVCIDQTPADPNYGQYAGRTGAVNGETCKWNDLLDTLLGPVGSTDAGFIANLDSEFAPNAAAGDPIRLGLTYFGGYELSQGDTIPNECAPGTIAVPIAPGSEGSIGSTLVGLVPAGGTPTAASLTELAASGVFPPPDPTLKVQRANYVIVITDGAPNCDSNFQPTAANCTDDQCTLQGTGVDPCPMASWGTAACACFSNDDPPAVIPQGCLDGDATVSAVQALAAADPPIKTFVIGYGSEAVSEHAVDALNRMGAAGGEAPDGGPTSYYQASSNADIQAALAAILNAITKPCAYPLAGPADLPDLIQVIVTPANGTPDPLSLSQYSYSASPPTVTITDSAVCDLIKASTPNDPVTVNISFASK